MDRDIRIERLEGAYAEQKAIIKALLEYSELELTSTIYGHVIKNKDGKVIQEILWEEVKKTMDERKKSIENASPKKGGIEILEENIEKQITLLAEENLKLITMEDHLHLMKQCEDGKCAEHIYLYNFNNEKNVLNRTKVNKAKVEKLLEQSNNSNVDF